MTMDEPMGTKGQDRGAGPEVDAADRDAPLAFDLWAPATARMNGLSPDARKAVLDEVGIEARVWVQGNRYWNAVLAREIAGRRLDRAMRCARYSVEETARREAA